MNGNKTLKVFLIPHRASELLRTVHDVKTTNHVFETSYQSHKKKKPQIKSIIHENKYHHTFSWSLVEQNIDSKKYL